MALDKRAQGFVQSQQQAPRGNKYGLSQDEPEVARSLAKGDDRLSDDQRLQTYATNKQRYRQARADGSYRDDQGRVTR
jgi:hypothetical protein